MGIMRELAVAGAVLLLMASTAVGAILLAKRPRPAISELVERFDRGELKAGSMVHGWDVSKPDREFHRRAHDGRLGTDGKPLYLTLRVYRDHSRILSIYTANGELYAASLIQLTEFQEMWYCCDDELLALHIQTAMKDPSS